MPPQPPRDPYVPPLSVPPTGPPPVAPSEPVVAPAADFATATGPRDAKRSSGGCGPSLAYWIIGLVLVSGVRTMINKVSANVTPSGVAVAGRELSRAEAKEGYEEIRAMIGDGRLQDPDTIEVSPDPKTDLGRRFRALILRDRQVRSTYRATVGDLRLESVLTADRLGSPEGRARSRREFTRWRGGMETLLTESRTLSGEYRSLFAGLPKEARGVFEADEADVLALSERTRKMIATAGNLLDLADRARPTVEEGGLVFDRDADLKRYDALLDEYNAQAKPARATP